MRCFFHLFHSEETILDTEGVEVESLDELDSEVLKALDELRREGEPVETWRGWTLSVTSGSGAPLLTTNLHEGVPKVSGPLAADLFLPQGKSRDV